MHVIISLILSVLIIAKSATGEAQDSVSIAVNMPLSGDLAVFGIPIQRGFILAQE